MPPITVIDNEFASLVVFPEEGIVHHTFKKVIGGEEFRNVLNTGTEMMRKYGGSKWLSDDRENSALSPEDTTWSMINWFPRAKAAGWKIWALVVPDNILAQMNLKEFVDSYYEQGLRIMVFVDPVEARAWLDEQK